MENKNQKLPKYKFIGGKRHNTYRQVDKFYNENDCIRLPKHTNQTKKGAKSTFGELYKTVKYRLVNGEFVICQNNLPTGD